MWKRIARLFVIKTRFEAYLIIYALAVGATSRGIDYLDQYPGTGGYLLAVACTGAVFLGGAKILDATPKRVKPPVGRRARVIARASNEGEG